MLSVLLLAMVLLEIQELLEELVILLTDLEELAQTEAGHMILL